VNVASRTRVAAALLLALAAAATLAACQPRPAVRPPAAAPAASSTPSATAFVDVNVVPMDAERVLRRQTVVVAGDRITALGPAASTPVPAGAARIDGAGRYLLPGLVDMHAHLWEMSDLLLYLASGVTTVRNMWGTIYQLEWRDRIAAGLMLGPRVITSGPLLDGAPPRWPKAQSLEGPEAARAAVRHHARVGYDFVKTYDGLDRETFAALAAAAREAGLPVAGHVPFAVGIREAMRSMASIEHLTGLALALQPASSPVQEVKDHLTRARAWQTIDLERLGAVAEQAKRAGTFFCPTLTAFSVDLSAEAVTRYRRRPEMALLAPTTRWDWRPETISDKGRAYVALLRRARAGAAEATRGLHDAGVPLLLGTDAGFYFVFPGRAVHEELRLLVVAAGLSPYQALRAATINPAVFLGLQGKSGVVAVGAAADLLLVEENPLEEVGHLSRRVGVMTRGRWLPQGELDRRVRRLAEGLRVLEAKGG
jgi:imidazolonepropionase-like amidohydrolase